MPVRGFIGVRWDRDSDILTVPGADEQNTVSQLPDAVVRNVDQVKDRVIAGSRKLGED